MTEPELEQIEARANAATAGPWHDDRGDVSTTEHWQDGYVVAVVYQDCERGQTPQEKADSAFIAAAREDVPLLCARVRALEAENAALQEALEEAQAYAVDNPAYRRHRPEAPR